MTEYKTEVLTGLNWSDLQEDDFVVAVHSSDETALATGKVRKYQIGSKVQPLWWLNENGFQNHDGNTFSGFKIRRVEREVEVLPVPNGGTFGWGEFEGRRDHGVVTEDGNFLFWNHTDRHMQEEPFDLISEFEPSPEEPRWDPSGDTLSYAGAEWLRKETVQAQREKDFEDYTKALELPTVDEIADQIDPPNGSWWTTLGAAERVLDFLKNRQQTKDMA